MSAFVRKINAVSSSEADFSKEFPIKVLIEATENYFSKILKRYIKILFPTDFFNGLGAFRTQRVCSYDKN